MAREGGIPPIGDDAAYWRKMYEEQLALQEDGFTALLADRDRYRDEVHRLEVALRETAQMLGLYFAYAPRDLSDAVAEKFRRQNAAPPDEQTSPAAAPLGEIGPDRSDAPPG